RSPGGVQRQVHVQPVCSARRLLCDVAIAHSPHLPELFPARCPVAVQWYPAGKGSFMNGEILLPASSARPCSGDGFLSEAVAGLSQPQKMLPCKRLYDEEGSR